MGVLTEPLFVGGPLVWYARALLVVVAAYNIYWGIPGIFNLFRGTNFPLSVFRTGVALVAGGTVGLNLTVLLGGEMGIDSALGLAFFCLLIAGQACLAYAHVSGIEAKIAKFFSLYPSIEKAVAIAELERLSPADAESIHTQTRRLIVGHLMSVTHVAEFGEKVPHEKKK